MRTEGCLVVLQLLLLQVHSNSDGPPQRACEEMEPGHGYSLKEEQYVIETNNRYFSPGHPIKVTARSIEEGTVFIGVMIQARVPGELHPVGTFSQVPEELQLMSCDKEADTVTHRDKRDKTSLTVTWNPPSTLIKQVHFVATFVKTYYSWNKEVTSGLLTFGVPPTPSPPPPPQPKATDQASNVESCHIKFSDFCE